MTHKVLFAEMAPLVDCRRYLAVVPRPLSAALLVVRRR